MRRSKVEVYLHLVWATWRRQPYLQPEIERAVYRCIEEQVAIMGATLIAIGGVENHLHLLVRIPSKLAIARLMNQVKGVSSKTVHEGFADWTHFRWQDHYAAFSVGRTQVEQVRAYALNQKAHHANGTLHSAWEETDEEAP
jgi:REP element-mobilizing transposase RayT